MTPTMSTETSTATSENHTRFAPHLEETLAEGRETRLRQSVVSILEALATVKRESGVFSDLYKASDVGFGNYHKVNEFNSLIHQSQDAIATKLSDVLLTKAQVEDYFSTRKLDQDRKLPTETEFDDSDVTFRDGMWSTLLAMRKAHRASAIYHMSLKGVSPEDIKSLISQNDTLPQDAERMQDAFEHSQTYAEASDFHKTIYHRFKAVLSDPEETRLPKEFKARL